jgi:hypothetical protein
MHVGMRMKEGKKAGLRRRKEEEMRCLLGWMGGQCEDWVRRLIDASPVVVWVGIDEP